MENISAVFRISTYLTQLKINLRQKFGPGSKNFFFGTPIEYFGRKSIASKESKVNVYPKKLCYSVKKVSTKCVLKWNRKDSKKYFI